MRDGVITEADTCREFVTPRLVEAAGVPRTPCHRRATHLHNGRIIVVGGTVRRAKPEAAADYLLYYRPRLSHGRGRGQGDLPACRDRCARQCVASTRRSLV